jgi:hypothetical protein
MNVVKLKGPENMVQMTGKWKWGSTVIIISTSFTKLLSSMLFISTQNFTYMQFPANFVFTINIICPLAF